MAGPSKPAPRKLKGEAPVTNNDTGAVGNNLKKKGTGQEPLNFKVDSEFNRDYRVFAASHGMKLNELLYACFELYREQKGGK